MKRVLLLVLMALTFNASYATNDEKSVVETATEVVNDAGAVVDTADAIAETVTGTKTEALFDKYSDKISDAIASLAEALQVPAAHVYAVLVRQHLALGLSQLLYPIFNIITIILALICLKRIVDWGDNVNEYNIMFVVLSGTTIILFGCTCDVLPDAIVNIMNPEYGAIKDIISWIK